MTHDMKNSKTTHKIKFYIYLFMTIMLILGPREKANGWGFYAHRMINRNAVFLLPEPLFNFYRYYIYAITQNAVNPDKRRSMVEGEDQKHYIDLDSYSDQDRQNMPMKWAEAIERFTEERLKQHGIVAWNISKMAADLRRAFKDRDVKRIVLVSADLGHYIADANVPLHTTGNYNGQLTGQYGIHGFWETRLPELFAGDYDLFLERASYVQKLEERAWQAVYKAHSCVKSVLKNEKELSAMTNEIDKYAFEQRGATIQKVYSKEYSTAYHKMLNGMVEQQMRASIKMVADVWYTCWVDAGKPDLEDLIGDTDVLKDLELKTEDKEGKAIPCRCCD